MAETLETWKSRALAAEKRLAELMVGHRKAGICQSCDMWIVYCEPTLVPHEPDQTGSDPGPFQG